MFLSFLGALLCDLNSIIQKLSAEFKQSLHRWSKEVSIKDQREIWNVINFVTWKRNIWWSLSTNTSYSKPYMKGKEKCDHIIKTISVPILSKLIKAPNIQTCVFNFYTETFISKIHLLLIHQCHFYQETASHLPLRYRAWCVSSSTPLA